ncbi:hypothetical protein ABZ897_51115 [Nonomuraea sp. NPDC046802]|uniref:hypothetical protein n=1 Tax=Nonomuraea sp. NPDC046802 TaxID=3154919 RepID=UPI0033DBA375
MFAKGARELIRTVAAVHPERGCLPTPTFRVPIGPRDFSSYLLYLNRILFLRDGRRHPAWETAEKACRHLAPERIQLIYEVSYWWYQNLCDLQRYLTPGEEENVCNDWSELRNPRQFHGHFARDLDRLAGRSQ